MEDKLNIKLGFMVVHCTEGILAAHFLRKGARTFTENRRKGNRLMCPAQPGHGGKRRDSPEGRVSSAITKLMQMIDHEPSNLNETQYSYITFGTLDCLGACLAMAV